MGTDQTQLETDGDVDNVRVLPVTGAVAATPGGDGGASPAQIVVRVPEFLAAFEAEFARRSAERPVA